MHEMTILCHGCLVPEDDGNEEWSYNEKDFDTAIYPYISTFCDSACAGIGVGT